MMILMNHMMAVHTLFGFANRIPIRRKENADIVDVELGIITMNAAEFQRPCGRMREPKLQWQAQWRIEGRASPTAW